MLLSFFRQLLYKYVTNEGEEMNCKDKAAVLIDGRNKINQLMVGTDLTNQFYCLKVETNLTN